MLSNKKFLDLDIIKESFDNYLSVGTSRSTKKLKTLHGSIAKDLEELLGKEYNIKSQGYRDDKEECIDGRYYNKKVDITIKNNGKSIAGLAIKFVMSNYSQNSNNYFENMLGETANLRSNSVPYFQIFIIFDKVPYYKSDGVLQKYDNISNHNLEKYLKLSDDDPKVYFHTPDKTLFILLSLKEISEEIKNKKDYIRCYKEIMNDEDLLSYSNKIDDLFGNSIILNNYEDFIKRMCALIIGYQKIKT
ncbi:hypothetical protein WFS22_00770 [Ureaplasma parvum]|nr:hypothetical protein [Ureaplasma parvum]ACA32820.1 conserved hypothetical protein [Ureaplasma parvum serovar 3 str. ATCC 27815]